MKKLSCLCVSAALNQLSRYTGKAPLLQIKVYDPREPGRARETHLAPLQAPGQCREAPVHTTDVAANKLLQGAEIVHKTPSKGRIPFTHSTNSPTEHFALLGSAFRAEVN